MLIKIQPRKQAHFGHLLRYMFQNQDALSRNGSDGFIYRHNVNGKTIPEWEQSFLDNEKNRQVNRVDSVRMRHIILSFGRDDRKIVNRIMLLDLTRRFIHHYDPLGMYLATVHYDREHIHIHICSSGIQYRSGKSIWKDNTQFKEVKRGLENYQTRKYPQLSHSVVNYQSRGISYSYQTDGEYRAKQRGKLTIKEQVRLMVNETMKVATTLSSLQSLLKELEISVYFRRGKPCGIVYNGKKYRFSKLDLAQDLNRILNHEKIPDIERSVQ